MTAPLLEVTDLVKTYNVGGQRLHAVDGVSLTVGPAETVGLVGESGSGKSTFGRNVVRLETPDSGRVVFDGVDMTALRGRELRRMQRGLQMVFQNPATSLNPLRTIEQTLIEPLDIHKTGDKPSRRARVAEVLERVGLGLHLSTRHPHELSGGQRQRVGIARALMLDPKVIVADEPTSALDLSVQAQIVNLLLELQERDGLSFLFITHDLSVVRHLSHRIVVLYLGRVVEAGPTEEVMTRVLHPYTAALVSGTGHDGRHGRIRLTGEIPSPIDRPTGCAFRTRCPAARAQCAVDDPPLVDVGGGHQVACIEPGVVELGGAIGRRSLGARSVATASVAAPSTAEVTQ